MTIADVEPTDGGLCGGTWNRRTLAVAFPTHVLQSDEQEWNGLMLSRVATARAATLADIMCILW